MNIEFRKDVLISMQRALLGMISPSVRAIAIGFEDEKKLKVIYYLDRKPNDNDYEDISEVTTEVCADIAFSEVEEVCIYTLKPFSELDHLTSWVYLRKEE